MWIGNFSDELTQIIGTTKSELKLHPLAVCDLPWCAYGRREKKPTKVTTNRPAWIPKGRTGNGRCKAGRCTGWLTPSGETGHPGQTCPNVNSKEEDLDTEDKRAGRNEKARKAVKNALEEELIEEMYKWNRVPRGALRGHIAATTTQGNEREGGQ